MGISNIFGLGKKLVSIFYKKEVPQQLLNQKVLENFMKMTNPVDVRLSNQSENIATLSFVLKDMINAIEVESIWIDNEIVNQNPPPIIQGFMLRKDKLMRKEDFEPDLEVLYTPKGKHVSAERIKEETDKQYEDYVNAVKSSKQKYLKFDGKRIINGRDNQLSIQFMNNPEQRGIIQVFSSFKLGELKKSIINYVNYT